MTVTFLPNQIPNPNQPKISVDLAVAARRNCDGVVLVYIKMNNEKVQRLLGATVARLTPDQKVACSNHVGVTLFHPLFAFTLSFLLQ